jgi:hypothetical protein
VAHPAAKVSSKAIMPRRAHRLDCSRTDCDPTFAAFTGLLPFQAPPVCSPAVEDCCSAKFDVPQFDVPHGGAAILE